MSTAETELKVQPEVMGLVSYEGKLYVIHRVTKTRLHCVLEGTRRTEIAFVWPSMKELGHPGDKWHFPGRGKLVSAQEAENIRAKVAKLTAESNAATRLRDTLRMKLSADTPGSRILELVQRLGIEWADGFREQIKSLPN
jgi:hypothetical protein